MARKTIGYVQLEWTCPNCETRNPGPHKYCNGCGAPQPEDVEFEQPAEQRLISDEAEIAAAKAGPDVHCPYCGFRNVASSKFCGSCGGGLEGGAARKRGRVLGAYRDEPAAPLICPSCGSTNPGNARTCLKCGDSLPRAAVPEPTPEPIAATPKKRAFPIAFAFIALACLAAVIALVVLLTRTEELTGEVQRVSWTRTIPILAVIPVERETWREEIPAQAEIGSCDWKYHHTQDDPAPGALEVCGTPYTLDTGTGQGEVVQDCVYEVDEEWCTYTALEWSTVNKVTASGSDLDPYWPEVQLASDQQAGEGEERYEATFASEQGVYTYITSSAGEFTQLVPGSLWVLTVNTFDAVVAVQPAE